MEIRILEDEELNKWNSLLEGFPGRTLFHTAEWLNFLEATFHLQKLPLGFYENGRLLGLFPALLDRKGPFKILGSPLTGWGTPYMGPLIDDERLDEAMVAIDGFANRLKVDYLEVRFPETTQRLPKMEIYDHQAVDTWILGLDCTEDEAWGKLKRECRNRVRKAQKSGVTIVEAQDRECIKEVYSMFVAAFAKYKTTTSKPLQYYYNLWDFLRPAGMIKVVFAEYEGKRIAGGAFVMNADAGYLMEAGSHREYNKVAPNNLVHWHFISWAARNGLRKYDMNGRGIESIDQFKQTFGCHAASWTQYSKTSSGLAKMGRRVYGAVVEKRLALQYQLNRGRNAIRKRDDAQSPNDHVP
jgi:hypothetical protein